MAVIVFEHAHCETAARLGEALRDHGHRLRVIRLHENASIPVDLDDVDGIVSMGGPMNVDDTNEHPWIEKELAFLRDAHERKLPIVGICLGAQLIATAFGGKVAAMDKPEIGWHTVKLVFPGTIDIVHSGIPWSSIGLHLHGQQIIELPAGAAPLSGSDACKVQAFSYEMNVYGFQYHFEWSMPQLQAVLKNVDIAAWIRDAGLNPEHVLIEAEKHYASYRHLGDRLCKNIVDMLFPIDKRLEHKAGILTSFDPAVS